MGVINGSIVGMRIDGKMVDCEVSSSVTITQEARPATHPSNTGRWKNYIAGAKDWSMSLNGLLTDGVDNSDVRTVIDAIDSGALIEIDFIASDLSFLLTGKALPTNVTVSAPASEDVSYTCDFVGSSPLSRTIVVWSQDGDNAVESTGKLISV